MKAYRALAGWRVPDERGGWRDGFYADPEGRMLLVVPALDQVEDDPPLKWWQRKPSPRARRSPSPFFRQGHESPVR